MKIVLSIMVSTYSRHSFTLKPPPLVLLFQYEVKVFTLSGSHQQYQSHLCDSFSWNCCNSLKSYPPLLFWGVEIPSTHIWVILTGKEIQFKVIALIVSTTAMFGGWWKRGIFFFLLWSSLLFWQRLSSHCVVMWEINVAGSVWGHWLTAVWHRSYIGSEGKRGSVKET